MAIPSYVGVSSRRSGASPNSSGSFRVLLESTPATAVRQRPRTCSRSASSGTSMDTDCSCFPSMGNLASDVCSRCHVLIRLIDGPRDEKAAGTVPAPPVGPRNASNGQRDIHSVPVPLGSVTRPATGKISATLRDIAAALAVAARQLSWARVAATVAVITVLGAVAMWVPLPAPVQMRDWAQSVGPWFPLAFLAAHIVTTIFPIPRTAFTLAAGLLFGPVLGIAIAVVASTASAVISVLLVRAAGWRLNRLGLVRHGSIETVDARLRQRGWLAILSLRLIPAVPFSVLNYAAGASAVRLLPYTLATFFGL